MLIEINQPKKILTKVKTQNTQMVFYKICITFKGVLLEEFCFIIFLVKLKKSMNQFVLFEISFKMFRHQNFTILFHPSFCYLIIW